MTVREILNIFKKNELADRQELADVAGVSKQSLVNMIGRNDMKLSTFVKIVNGEGYDLILFDGQTQYKIENLD